ELPPDLFMPEPLSPAVVHLTGVSETNFTPRNTTIGFSISEGAFSTDPAGAKIFLNGVQAAASSIQVTSTLINFTAALAEGINQVSFFGFDAEGRIVHKAATLWAGNLTLAVSVVDQNNQPASGALVTARLG